ncbi:MAG: 3'-5' exonuclease [Rickettsiaceae bacterium]|nr:3'-5' exonuclease [Rickettsiaceae bacterium]
MKYKHSGTISLFDQLKNIACTELVVVDTETTGLSSAKDKIIQFAAKVIHPGFRISSKPSDTLIKYFNPGFLIPPEATQINHITDEMVKNAGSFRDHAEEIYKFLDGKKLVFHNAKFDLSFINKELQQAGFETLKNEYIDTLEISRSLFPFHKPPQVKYCNQLFYLVSRLGYDLSDANLHNAECDIVLTARLLPKLVALVDYGQINSHKAPLKLPQKCAVIDSRSLPGGEICEISVFKFDANLPYNYHIDPHCFHLYINNGPGSIELATKIERGKNPDQMAAYKQSIETAFCHLLPYDNFDISAQRIKDFIGDLPIISPKNVKQFDLANLNMEFMRADMDIIPPSREFDFIKAIDNIFGVPQGKIFDLYKKIGLSLEGYHTPRKSDIFSTLWDAASLQGICSYLTKSQNLWPEEKVSEYVHLKKILNGENPEGTVYMDLSFIGLDNKAPIIGIGALKYQDSRITGDVLASYIFPGNSIIAEKKKLNQNYDYLRGHATIDQIKSNILQFFGESYIICYGDKDFAFLRRDFGEEWFLSNQNKLINVLPYIIEVFKWEDNYTLNNLCSKRDHFVCNHKGYESLATSHLWAYIYSKYMDKQLNEMEVLQKASGESKLQSRKAKKLTMHDFYDEVDGASVNSISDLNIDESDAISAQKKPRSDSFDSYASSCISSETSTTFGHSTSLESLNEEDIPIRTSRQGKRKVIFAIDEENDVNLPGSNLSAIESTKSMNIGIFGGNELEARKASKSEISGSAMAENSTTFSDTNVHDFSFVLYGSISGDNETANHNHTEQHQVDIVGNCIIS